MRNEFGYLGDATNDGRSFGDPGTTETRCCGVCGSVCVIERAINGPTNWASALAGDKRLHYVFRCPHYGSEWHNLALRLVHEMRDTASTRIRTLIEADLDDLVDANLPIGKCSNCGLVFDIACEIVCPGCGNEECTAYKPWMHGCNSSIKEFCRHRGTCGFS